MLFCSPYSKNSCMIIFKKVDDIKNYISEVHKSSTNIGFVPTMGALHIGHISLINKAKKENDIVVCSIFLNPTQFNDKNDFEKYPISTPADIDLLIKANCDILFLPSVEEIYPDGEAGIKSYDFGYLDTILEGAGRPGHFKGVGQVVGRLLDIVQPDSLYLGQKDYQQCMVIKQLLVLLKINNIKVHICTTYREDDGLAMSSRNRRLTESQRSVAGVIYQCLVSIKTKQNTDSFATVKMQCEELLTEKGLLPEYIQLADAETLRILNDFEPATNMIVFIAAKIGAIRLIDNMLL